MKQLSLFEQQREFFLAMESPSLRTHSREFCCQLAENLIEEEVNKETIPVLRKFALSGSLEHLTELADGIVDSVYVLLHAANSLGIPFDSVWNAVQSANMAKIWPDGTAHRREDGKVLKPAGWTPPDIHSIMLEHQTVEQYGEQYMKKGMVT